MRVGEGGVLMREAAWLAQLQLLAGLRHSLLTLAPAIAAAVRAGLRADFSSVGLFDAATGAASATWIERVSEPVLRWISGHRDELFARVSVQQQIDSDGDAIRVLFDDPAWLRDPVFLTVFAPMNVRWCIGVPLRSGGGRCYGLMYLYRSAAAGRFSDADQARLREARDRLQGVGCALPGSSTPVRQVPMRTAMLRIDVQGRIQARSAHAYELLFLSQQQRIDSIGWAADDVRALPPPVEERVWRLLRDAAGPATDEITLRDVGGGVRFNLERLRDEADRQPEVVVAMAHLEPVDLAVARQLQRWPLTPREKQLIVASVDQPNQRLLASAMGCTVGTLKGYVNTLHAKLGIGSREVFVQQLLDEAVRAERVT